MWVTVVPLWSQVWGWGKMWTRTHVAWPSFTGVVETGQGGGSPPVAPGERRINCRRFELQGPEPSAPRLTLLPGLIGSGRVLSIRGGRTSEGRPPPSAEEDVHKCVHTLTSVKDRQTARI